MGLVWGESRLCLLGASKYSRRPSSRAKKPLVLTCTMKTSSGRTGLYPPAVAPANGLPMFDRLFAMSTPVVESRPRSAAPMPTRLMKAPVASVRTTSALRGGLPSSAPASIVGPLGGGSCPTQHYRVARKTSTLIRDMFMSQPV